MTEDGTARHAWLFRIPQAVCGKRGPRAAVSRPLLTPMLVPWEGTEEASAQGFILGIALTRTRGKLTFEAFARTHALDSRARTQFQIHVSVFIFF